MSTHRIPRPGAVDLVLEGELLVDETSFEDGKERWAEIRIYRADSGRWVVENIAKSTRKGERDKPRVFICATPEEVRDALLSKKPSERTGERYLTDLAYDALSGAAAKDTALSPALVETI